MRGAAKALSIPPGEYAGTGETQRNSRGTAQPEENVVLFDDTRGSLPGLKRKLTYGESHNPAMAICEVLHGCRQLVP